ncbi:MAG: cell division protein FtsZ [Methanoregula sp.]|jgi:cell division protein FtsZ|nr:cell division protein FtsZ [Methanoregula sp.]
MVSEYDGFKYPKKRRPYILIIGNGGAGNHIIDSINSSRFPGVKTVTVDTDKKILDSTHTDLKILLGNGLNKRSGEENPDESANAVIEGRSGIEHLFEPGGIVFIVAGLCRSSGSGAAPQIAKIAREKGALVIALVSLPCLIQNSWIQPLEDYLHHLIDSADSVIVVQNNWIHEHFCYNHPTEIYTKVDGIILGVLESLVNSLTPTCLENCDPEDFRAIFRDRGLAIVLYGESDINVVNTNESVVRNCLKSPSLEINYHGAGGCFVLIMGGNDLNRFDTEEIATSLTYDLDPHADVIWSSTIKKDMEGHVRVYAIVTGIGGKR